ncbi:bacterial proteasome activator family protein [soil metagenome]
MSSVPESTTDGSAPAEGSAPVEHPEVFASHSDFEGMDSRSDSGESIERPAKVMRIGSMIKQLLDEVRSASLDGPGRDRLREIYETSVTELAAALSPELRDELGRLAPPFSDGTPTEAELRVAQAQLVGWLEGLFHGIQAALFAQQMAARQQLEEMHRRLPPGQPGSDTPDRPGTYL